jgi:hypothetical protein
VRKYNSKRPIYIVLGDFNIDLEEWSKEANSGLTSWEIYPTDNKPARDFRSRPIDYVLIRSHEDKPVWDDGSRMFSPLPLEIKGQGDKRTYYCCTKADLHLPGESVEFTKGDLKSKKPRNSPYLHGDFPYLIFD